MSVHESAAGASPSGRPNEGVQSDTREASGHTAATRAGRNIILLSDGTGNSAAKAFKTNVWRLYKALDLTRGTQIAFYDDGVGTSGFKPIQILGGAGVFRAMCGICTGVSASTIGRAITSMPSDSAAAPSRSGRWPA